MTIPEEFTISNGFPGTYKNAGGSSWYLNGDTGADAVHFTVHNDDLSGWHLTYSLTGSNVGIWYNGGSFSNVNSKNVPKFKLGAWNTWWKDNKSKCDEAAADFYNQFK